VETAFSQPLAQERVIKPRRGFIGIDFAELWRYRELFLFLIWKSILVRYKQTVMGILWAVIRPIMLMIVFTIIFGKLAKFNSHGIPYPLFTFAALLPWQFFAQSLSESSNSLVMNPNLISKIYCPRLILPSSAVLSGAVDFLISFTVFVGLMAWYRSVPTLAVVWLPLFLLLAMTTASGFGFWFSALNVKYRDVRHAVPFMIQFGLYISPVGYSSSQIPAELHTLYSLNPMVGVIDGFRWALLGQRVPLNFPGLALSALVALLLFVSGIHYFRKVEKTFADII